MPWDMSEREKEREREGEGEDGRSKFKTRPCMEEWNIDLAPSPCAYLGVW